MGRAVGWWTVCVVWGVYYFIKGIGRWKCCLLFSCLAAGAQCLSIYCYSNCYAWLPITQTYTRARKGRPHTHTYTHTWVERSRSCLSIWFTRAICVSCFLFCFCICFSCRSFSCSFSFMRAHHHQHFHGLSCPYVAALAVVVVKEIQATVFV